MTKRTLTIVLDDDETPPKTTFRSTTVVISSPEVAPPDHGDEIERPVSVERIQLTKTRIFGSDADYMVRINKRLRGLAVEGQDQIGVPTRRSRSTSS